MKNRKWKLDMGTQSPEKKGRGFHRGGWLGKQRFGPALLLVLGLILGSTVTVQAQSLDTLIDRMLRDNPKLESLRMDYESASYKEGEFKDLPDPMISTGFFPLAVESGMGPQQLQIGISQTLPWNTVLQNRAQVAREEANLLKVKYHIAEKDLTLGVEQLYLQIWRVNEEIELLKSRLPLIQAWNQVSLSKMSANQVSASDVLQIQVFINEVENAIKVLENQKKSYRVRLHRILGTDQSSGDAPNDMDIDLNPDTTLQRSVESVDNSTQLPDLDWFDQQMQISEAVLERNTSEGFPTIGLGLEYTIVGKRKDVDVPYNGRDMIMPMLSVKIPIYRKKYDAVRQREKALQASIHLKKRDKELEIQENIALAEVNIETEMENLRIYNEQIEILERTVNMLYAEYSSEGSKFIELLQMQNQLIDFALKKLDAKVKIHNSNLIIKRWQP